MSEDQVRAYIHSLEPEEYAKFMKQINFDYPKRTPELSADIANAIKNDFSVASEIYYSTINDRKDEYLAKAKEARRADRNRIVHMNSRTGLHPLELFPKEIWLMLLELITPVERLHFYHLHHFFRELVDDNAIRDVFLPQIMSVEVVPFWRPDEEIEEQVPVKSALARFSTLRLLCKSVRDAIDGWYEETMMHDLRDGVMTLEPINGFSINLEKLDDCKKVGEIITRLQSSTSQLKMRFFTHALKILSPYRGEYNVNNSPEERDLFEQVEGKINEMLNRMGDQIWFFHFKYVHPASFEEFNSTKRDLPSRYKSMLEWLAKMPNLRWLKITINPIDMVYIESEELKRFYDTLVAPPLPQLERLDVELTEHCDRPVVMINHIIRSYHLVKILNLSGMNMSSADGVITLNPGWFNHHNLSTQITTIGVRDPLPSSSHANDIDDDDYSYPTESEPDFDWALSKSDEDVALLQNIILNRWALKRLELRLNFTKINLDLIFDMIGTIKSLEDLCLSVESPIITEEMRCLDLPKLSRFSIGLTSNKREMMSMMTDFPNRFFSMYFLNLAKELQNLNVAFDMTMENWQKILSHIDNVKFLGKRMNFDKLLLSLVNLCDTETVNVKNCNIWQVFANLNRIQLRLLVRDDRMRIKKSVWEDCKKCELI